MQCSADDWMFFLRSLVRSFSYTHKVAKAIEYMIVDAMVEANDAFQIVEKAQSPQSFLELDDSILKRIEYANPQDDDSRLRKAKSVVERIRRRKLYKSVAPCSLHRSHALRTSLLPPFSLVTDLEGEDLVLEAKVSGNFVAPASRFD